MKIGYYKEKGALAVETSIGGGFVYVTDGGNDVTLRPEEVEFLMKCFTELLED